MDDRNSTTDFVFFYGKYCSYLDIEKQPIVTLSTCEVEFVSATSCVCHAMWLKIC